MLESDLEFAAAGGREERVGLDLVAEGMACE